MSNLSDFLTATKPKRVTRLTSGTGTFTPLRDNALCMVRLQAGGGAGASGVSYRSGGGGGAMVEFWVRVPIAGVAYTVGAGGAGVVSGYGGDGGNSRFGNMTADSGKGGGNTNPGEWPYARGGLNSQQAGFATATSASVLGGSVSGVAGGAGGLAGAAGSAPGFPASLDNSSTNYILPIANGQSLGSGQVGGGGDSFFGIGGNASSSGTANGGDGTGYGSGGGATVAATPYRGGNGAGGLIEIIEYMGT